MGDETELIAEQKKKLKKALDHLRYSHHKVLRLSTDPAQLDEEAMETWEGYVARFGRVSDIFIAKYLRSLVLRDDPGFDGSLRDLLNRAEKMKYIHDARLWLEMRELRNRAAHEYSESALGPILERIRELVPHLLVVEEAL